MKTCKYCKELLTLDNFYTYKHGDKITYYARCKPCHRIHYKASRPVGEKAKNRRASRANAQKIVDDAKSKPCMDCKKEYPPYVMDLDHVRGDKFKNVAKMVGRYSKEALLEEIAKCDVVCANCHRLRTHERLRSDNG